MATDDMMPPERREAVARQKQEAFRPLVTGDGPAEPAEGRATRFSDVVAAARGTAMGDPATAPPGPEISVRPTPGMRRYIRTLADRWKVVPGRPRSGGNREMGR